MWMSLISNTGWWLTYPSEKYHIISWDDDIPNIWKVIQNSMVPVTTNQRMVDDEF
jgi:hypothetical protein